MDIKKIKELWQQEREELLKLYRQDGALTARDYIGLRDELDQWYLKRLHTKMALGQMPDSVSVSQQNHPETSQNSEELEGPAKAGTS